MAMLTEIVFIALMCIVGTSVPIAGTEDCLQDEFRCESGECIKKSQACDEYPHCTDSSDERQACRPLRRHSCPSGWVRCRHGEDCVSTDWLCDGTNDCSDHSDEVPCSSELSPDYIWSDLSILDQPRLHLSRVNQTFEEFGLHVGRKLRSVGVVRALLLERLINEVLFLGQLGIIDEESYFCDSKGKRLF